MLITYFLKIVRYWV